MIISVAKLKTFITTTVSDQVLEDKLQALESLIRKYTNNNFQDKNIRFVCDAYSDDLVLTTTHLKVDDTIQITQSQYNDGVYNITAIDDDLISLNENLTDEVDIVVTKVKYPYDIQMGVVNMINWDLNNRDKVGIQSEAISRHSVSYFNMDGDNSTIGYPKSLVGFLEPYKKARF